MASTISAVYHYPLKSAKGVFLNSAEVLLTGIKNDRALAVIDENNKIITGRQFPALIKVISKIEGESLILETPSSLSFRAPLPLDKATLEVGLFRNRVLGTLFDEEASRFISTYLKGNFRLIALRTDFIPLSEKRGGFEGEYKGYADSAPIHLINRSTLEYLNGKLKDQVSSANFRPNLIVDGVEPFEEDQWKSIQINGCKFRVQERTQRCIFTTIDPETTQKNSDVEPLATLAKLRAMNDLPPTFGIGLVPESKGAITVGDPVVVESI